jgi:hypothetical protein
MVYVILKKEAEINAFLTFLAQYEGVFEACDMQRNKPDLITSGSARAASDDPPSLDKNLISLKLEKIFWDALIVICGNETADQENYFMLSQCRYPSMTSDQALMLCLTEDLRDLVKVGEQRNCQRSNYVLHDSATTEGIYQP